MPKLAEHVKATLDSGKRVSLTAIMVTTDFSEVSDRALDYAVALARRYDARIYLTHVITADPFQFAEPHHRRIDFRKVTRRCP